MAYLAAISTTTTIPLFIRTKGDLPQLSFPVVGSLSSVHLYASNMRTALHSCSSEGSKVIWKCFHDSVTLILVTGTEGESDIHLMHLLDLVFSAMVLLIGLQDLENIADPERLKRRLKCCYPLVDHLLEGTTLLSPLTQCVEVMVSPDRDNLLGTLAAFTEAAKSNFGCLIVHGRICVATSSWWDLSTLEKNLLSLFIHTLPPTTCSDIPVYLPQASNKVPHRLVTLQLVEGVSVSILCNPQPLLSTVQDLVNSYWTQMASQLRNSALLHPRNIPFSLNVKEDISAFCLVNMDSRQCLTSLRPEGLPVRIALSAGFQGELSQAKKLKYLSQFLKTTLDKLLPLHREASSEESADSSSLRSRVSHKILETYTHAKRYKAYAVNRDKHNLFVIFSPATPNFALRRMALNLLDYLVTTHKILVN